MNREIRLLSLWQPWASLIACGLKHYETRSWGTGYRGLIAIHAAKRKMHADDESVYLQACKLANVPHRKLANLELGCIVAIAELTGCPLIIDTQIAGPRLGRIYLESQSQLERTVGDWASGRYAWKLENVLALPEPMPFLGTQGMRRLDEGVIAQIEQRLSRGGAA